MGPSRTTGEHELSGSFPDDTKDVAVRCWRAVREHSGIDDKVLADEAGMSPGHFSRVSSGEQGDLLGLIYRLGQRRPELRRDFICRLAEHEGADPKVVAADQLVAAALRFLRLCGAVRGLAIEGGR